MNRLDEVAIITFIVCDVILENTYEMKCLYDYYYENLKVETKDIVKRLFK